MRTITANLFQNTGSAILGSQVTLSTSLVKVGTRDLQVDEQLTKINPSELTVEVQDPTDAIWTFIQTELATSQGLLPPWLQLVVGGSQVFLGIVDPSRIIRHLSASTHSIEIGAQDWSIQLSKSYLGAPSANPWAPGKAYAAGDQVMYRDSVYQAVTPGTSGSVGPAGTGSSIPDGSNGLTWAYVPPGWQRPVPQVASNQPTSQTTAAFSPDLYWIAGGLPSTPIPPQYTNIVIIPGGANFAQQGDRVTIDLSPSETGAGFNTGEDTGITYTVMEVKTPPDPSVMAAPGNNNNGFAIYNPNNLELTQLTLNLTVWPTDLAQAALNAPGDPPPFGPSAPIPCNITRLPNVATDANYYTVVLPISKDKQVNTISLNTVSGIFPGDTLRCVHGAQSASWNILSINPELMSITTQETVSNLNNGDEIYFDPATNAEMVMQDARSVISQALSPYRADFSRFVQPTTPMPVFGWLPLRGTAGASDLMAISDLDTALINGTPVIRAISGFTNVYHGSPDTGWTAETPVTLPSMQPQYADWTCQTSTAPSSLMPYEVRSLSPNAFLRNRVYNQISWQAMDNGPMPGYTPAGYNPNGLTNPYNPAIPSTWFDNFTDPGLNIGNLIPEIILYDYLNSRKIVVTTGGTFQAPGSQTVTAYPWSGTGFGTGVGLTGAPGGTGFYISICNFPTGPAGSYLGITDQQVLVLVLSNGSTVTCDVPPEFEYAALVPTPYGPYLVGQQGYGPVTYSNGVLDFTYANLPDQITILWPNTFVARSSSEAICLGRLDAGDGTGNVTTSTILFRLSMVPDNSTPLASIIQSETIAKGSPTFAGAILDPTKPGRVIGHYGGALWQVDTQMPWTVERFTPGGMTALECVEHVAQLYGAMAIPQPNGTMALVSRSITETPTALNVLQVVNDQMLCWEHFYSIVRCSTQDGGTYYDAPVLGGKIGGNLLEVQNQPMLWTLSQAGAMAETYAAWFGLPRAKETQTWTYPDSNSAAPWEALEPFASVTVNGTGPWRVMGTTVDYVKGTCKAVLVAQ